MATRILKLVMTVIMLLSIFFTVANFFPFKTEAKSVFGTWFPETEECKDEAKNCVDVFPE